jgi:hypothetical protein
VLLIVGERQDRAAASPKADRYRSLLLSLSSGV